MSKDKAEKDKLTFRINRVDGFLLQLAVNSGGVKNFILFDGVVGFICVLFTWATGSLLPFIFWACGTGYIFYLFGKLAKDPQGRAFFLDTSYFYKYLRWQAELLGDKEGGKLKLDKPQEVQPILDVPGDIMTEAKIDARKAIAERSQTK